MDDLVTHAKSIVAADLKAGRLPTHWRLGLAEYDELMARQALDLIYGQLLFLGMPIEWIDTTSYFDLICEE